MYTKHAKDRMQQRGLGPFVVNLLLDYGTEEHDGKGAVRRFFDKKARRSVKRALGHQVFRRVDDLLDAYLIEKDGKIITVGWRH